MLCGPWNLNKGFFLTSLWLEHMFENSVIKDRHTQAKWALRPPIPHSSVFMLTEGPVVAVWMVTAPKRRQCFGPLPVVISPFNDFQKKYAMGQASCDLRGFPEDSRDQGDGSRHVAFPPHPCPPKKSLLDASLLPVSALGPITSSSPPLRSLGSVPLSGFLLLPYFLASAAVSFNMRLESHLHPMSRTFPWKLSFHTVEFSHTVLHIAPLIISCWILTAILGGRSSISEKR